jgi:hypothetical protein
MPKQQETNTTQRSHMILKVMVEWVAAVLDIWDILDSNLVPKTGYPD